MTRRVVTHDDVTLQCELAELVPYPQVTAVPGITVGATVLPSGQTIYNVGAQDDPLTPLAGVAGLTAAQRGLSLGEVDIPTDRALTHLETTQLNADRVSIPLSRMRAVFTNRAAEPGQVNGMMNFDGSLGFYSVGAGFSTISTFNANMANIVSRYNGFRHRLDITAADTGSLIQMPPPAYGGQICVLFVFASVVHPQNDYIEIGLQLGLTGGNSAQGIARTSRHRIDQVEVGTDNYVILRDQEYIVLRGIGTAWGVLSFVPRQLYGVDWRENLDGTASIARNVSWTQGTNVVGLAPLPIQITNFGPAPAADRVRATMLPATSGGPYANGSVLSAADQNRIGNIIRVPQADTPVALGFAWRTVTGIAPTAPRNMDLIVERAAIDYPALGGMASF